MRSKTFQASLCHAKWHRTKRAVVRWAARMFAVTYSGLVLSMTSAHATKADDGSLRKEVAMVDFNQPLVLDNDPSEFLPEAAGNVADGVVEAQPAPVRTSLFSMVERAYAMIGIPYRWGGNDPESGLDCSGFVRYVYQRTTGLQLPRQSAEISKTGSAIAERDLHPGDLVFFNTPRGRATHVGIYVGDEQFIHAPRTGAFIRVESLKSTYWASRYYGARRL
jgi:cell wall-associated NlpC family hydrolase